jgi:hypothetical protein
VSLARFGTTRWCLLAEPCLPRPRLVSQPASANPLCATRPPYLCFCHQSNCFKGELKAANTSLLGKNDYKKVRDKLLEEFPGLSKKSLKRVFSDKEETYVLKCSNGTVLYAAGDKPPSFFDDGFGDLVRVRVRVTLTLTLTLILTLTLTLALTLTR